MDKINIVSSQVVQTTGETVNSITCLWADNFCLQVKKGPVFSDSHCIHISTASEVTTYGGIEICILLLLYVND